MTEQKQIPDRMQKYKGAFIGQMVCLGVGAGVLIAGCHSDRSSLSIAGSSLMIYSLLDSGIDYMKGYFNERLELENQRNASSKLEKNLSQGEK